MSDEAKRYNGYANYETWCVTLWLENDQGSVEYWRDEARRHRKEAPRCEQVREGIWTAQQAERFRLADQLKESFEDFHPFRGEHLAKPKEPDVYSELLDAALSEVDWHEVAEAFLDGLEPEDDGPDGSDDDDEEDEDAEAFEQQKQERLREPERPAVRAGPGREHARSVERSHPRRHHEGPRTTSPRRLGGREARRLAEERGCSHRRLPALVSLPRGERHEVQRDNRGGPLFDVCAVAGRVLTPPELVRALAASETQMVPGPMPGFALTTPQNPLCSKVKVLRPEL